MGRALIEDHRLRLEDGRTIGYSGWGDPAGMPVLFGHGTPGSRRDRYYPGLDDQEWLLRRRVHFIGVDSPGYGYSDPWPEAGLLDCGGDLARVADHLGLERFWALGTSGGGPYFDLVVAGMALMDIANAKGALLEAGRVLGVGGRLAASLIHPCFDTGEENSCWVAERYAYETRVFRKVGRYRELFEHGAQWHPEVRIHGVL